MDKKHLNNTLYNDATRKYYNYTALSLCDAPTQKVSNTKVSKAPLDKTNTTATDNEATILCNPYTYTICDTALF